MTETELIQKLKELKQIKPNNDWVLLTKNQILGQAQEENKMANIISVFRVFFLKPAYVSVLSIFVVLGLFTVSRTSLPGDPLYPIKKITEKSQAFFVSENDKPNFQLKLTNARLNELAQIAQSNETGKLSPALKELAATKTEVQKEVANSIKGKSTEEAIKIAREIAPELKAINEKETEVLGSLGLEQGKEETGEPAEKAVVEVLLNDLQNASLTQEQSELLSQAKEAYQAGNFWQALEQILFLSNNK